MSRNRHKGERVDLKRLDEALRADHEFDGDVSLEHYQTIRDAARAYRDALASGEQVKRYATHHVYLGEDGFTVEHPITCDLRACPFFERLRELWNEQPEPTGWYEVDLNGAISRAQERQTYRICREPL